MLEIQGIRVEGGTKKETYIGPDAYPMPAFLIAGRREGKTILVTAQIHSGEYPGTHGPACKNPADRCQDCVQARG